MDPWIRYLLMIAVVIGHFGLHLAIYNRVNGFGWPRKRVKRMVKVFFVNALVLPIIVVLFWRSWGGWLAGESDLPIMLLGYSWLCLAAWIVLGVPWLLWRPLWGIEWVDAKRQVEAVNVEREVGISLAATRQCKYEASLPLNQIFELSVETIELPVVGLPAALDGYRIAHLSDIHLTGDVKPDYMRYTVQRAMEWNPHMVALTGDIIDTQECVGWIDDLFAGVSAPDGCYFVLGNHDTRIADPRDTRSAMEQAGWVDVGGRTKHVSLGGVPVMLIGNEHPWFDRPTLDKDRGDEQMRLLLSHSPDQFSWAREHDVTLMLAGHTHGGQGRLPLAGPLLSPSFHGSRYASGDFYRTPTTLHVTRGLGAVHLMRINCRPELSLLVLRA